MNTRVFVEQAHPVPKAIKNYKCLAALIINLSRMSERNSNRSKNSRFYLLSLFLSLPPLLFRYFIQPSAYACTRITSRCCNDKASPPPLLSIATRKNTHPTLRFAPLFARWRPSLERFLSIIVLLVYRSSL